MPFNPSEARWQAQQARCLAEACATAAERLEAACDGAPRTIVEVTRMLRLNADELADRARKVAHRVQSELHDDDQDDAA